MYRNSFAKGNATTFFTVEPLWDPVLYFRGSEEELKGAEQVRLHLTGRKESAFVATGELHKNDAESSHFFRT